VAAGPVAADHDVVGLDVAVEQPRGQPIPQPLVRLEQLVGFGNLLRVELHPLRRREQISERGAEQVIGPGGGSPPARGIDAAKALEPHRMEPGQQRAGLDQQRPGGLRAQRARRQ
jgi:hypothetical protein